jgi:uncharacterized protein YqeY
MSLKLKISEELKLAMKEKNAIKLSILRVLKGELERNEQTKNGKVELNDVDIFKIIKKLILSINETTNNQDELNVLNSFLPKQLTKDEIMEIVNANNFENVRDSIKYFNQNHAGLFDSKILVDFFYKKN